MLSSQRKPVSSLPLLSLSFHIGALGHGPDVPANDSDMDTRYNNPSSLQHPELTPTAHTSSPSCSPTASTTPSSHPSLVESPGIPSSDRCLSHLATTAAQDDYNRGVHSWTFERRPSFTPQLQPHDHTHQHQSIFRRQSTGSFLERTSTPLSSSFGFTVVSSPESADVTRGDVIPKVEELDDNDPLSILEEHEECDTMEAFGQEQAQPDGTNGVSGASDSSVPPKRKRGRPRKHPLPVPGQIKVTKGRSKTGCITCRRRKKKCDETKPCCLNCQKNAVVCEGYPMKEIWRSGKQKTEEGM